MGNRDTEAILEYHESTKHSERSIRTNRHTLDWENQPLPFKIYRGLDPIPLVKDFPARSVPALDAIAEAAAVPVSEAAERIPDLAMLSRVLYLSAGITKRRPHPGGETYFWWSGIFRTWPPASTTSRLTTSHCGGFGRATGEGSSWRPRAGTPTSRAPRP
jgi:hypothetical protein